MGHASFDSRGGVKESPDRPIPLSAVAVKTAMAMTSVDPGRFEGRYSVRTWLYRIATNVCLTSLSGSQRRLLPSGAGATIVRSLRTGPLARRC
jgi:hypothetical protein